MQIIKYNSKTDVLNRTFDLNLFELVNKNNIIKINSKYIIIRIKSNSLFKRIIDILKKLNYNTEDDNFYKTIIGISNEDNVILIDSDSSNTLYYTYHYFIKYKINDDYISNVIEMSDEDFIAYTTLT